VIRPAYNPLRPAFSLVEMLVAGSIIAVLAVMLAGAGWQVYKNSSLAVSASNIRQLAAGGAAYLAENNHRFWKYRTTNEQPTAVVWWFGLEPEPRPEGQRLLVPDGGPLAGYVPAALRPDPGFRLSGVAFKPKFRFGYIGIGYNTHLGGGWMPGTNTPVRSYWDLPRPGEIVVFATSAQINTFQAPATPKKPLIEEFYGLSDNETTVHFRHADFAMVGFADGSAGFLPMDRTTLDLRAPKAAIGRFAPKGSSKHLLPTAE
jgi:hypothetical protein